MREIKFRIWDNERKELVDINNGKIAAMLRDNGIVISTGYDGEDNPIWDWLKVDINRYSAMQFTGLKDKNGIEIYEGDILNVCNGSINGTGWMDKPYEVKYILNHGFNMCMFCWDKEGSSQMDNTHWCEVIGNIYENPELIKC